MEMATGHVHPRHIDAYGEQRLAHLLWSHRRVAVTQIVELMLAMIKNKTRSQNAQWGHKQLIPVHC